MPVYANILFQPGTLPNNTVITATNSHEKVIEPNQRTSNPQPPPLAPLSSSIIKPIIQTKIDDKSIIIESGDINSNNGSQKANANKMLADLLGKKSDPPHFETVTVTGKRKIENVSDVLDSSAKRIEIDDDDDDDEIEEVFIEEKSSQSKKAADLYAELAGSILEDEDVEEEPTILDQKQLVTVPKQPPAVQKQVITVPVPLQRQIIMSSNNQNQMILQQGQGNAHATATIKTESGFQTVPIIFQHPGGQGGVQIQKQVNAAGVQPTLISTPPNQPQQYILATNPQGQTYVVAQAQNPNPVQQTVLLAQAPQHHGAPGKTIIILQQQGGNHATVGLQAAPGVQSANQSTPQKVIMTTPQGQQLLVTQAAPRQQIIMNHNAQQPQSGGNIICAQTQSGQKIYITRDDKKQVVIHQQKERDGGQVRKSLLKS